MYGDAKQIALSTKERLIAKGKAKLREAAIKNAKKRIALAGKSPEGFTPKELEAIVAEEESKLKEKLKKGSLIGLLVFFGLDDIYQ